MHNYAIRLYAPGSGPAAGVGSGAYRLLEDPIAEAMPLRYTDDEPADPARLLAVWSSQLIDRLVQTAGTTPKSAAEPANS